MMQGNVMVVILAGGQARRMGGECKLLLEIGGVHQTILGHICAALRADLQDYQLPLAINCNEPPQDLQHYDLPIFPDLPENLHQGPLGGIRAAMDYAKAQNCEWVMTLSADTPFIPHHLISSFITCYEDLSHHLAKDTQLVLSAKSQEQVQPPISLFPVALASDLDRYLAKQIYKIAPFFQAYHWQHINFSQNSVGVMIDPFFNINTEEDLQQARDIIKEE